MTRYAEGTTVSIETSQTEIRRTVVTRYGATGFSVAEDDTAIGVEFVKEGLQVRLTLSIPPLCDDQFKHKTRWQTPDDYRNSKREAEVRRLWRVLLMIIKSKMEMVAAGQAFEREFFPFIVLPDGATVVDHALPQVLKAIQAGGGPPALLPSFERREVAA